jgi:hypothetical protein
LCAYCVFYLPHLIIYVCFHRTFNYKLNTLM